MLLSVAVLAYPVASDGTMQTVWASTVGFVAVVVSLIGLQVRRPAPATAWLLVVTGYGMWVIGDLVFSLEQQMLHLTSYPVPSDALYLGGYVALGAAFLIMVRNGPGARDFTAILDAAIIATGAAVVAAVFVFGPIASDPGLSVFGKLVSAGYPVADILLLGILVRLWATSSGRTRAVNLLAAALAVTVLADSMWTFTLFATDNYDTWIITDMMWLTSYVLVAAAVWLPSESAPAGRTVEAEPLESSRRRLVLLAGGLALPAATLITDGVVEGNGIWFAVGTGSLVLVALVLTRMFGLLKVVQSQAARLADLARSDGLTGAPNRRSWDHELARACRESVASGTPLSVALLDLDHFKLFNDTYGHPAGDGLLREAVSLWTAALAEGEFLARYGGEEFALLLPHRTPHNALPRLNQLRRLTPAGQTFSAGVALWLPSTEPGAAIVSADAAMYQAKRLGRDQVVISHAGVEGRMLIPTIVLQPIVDLGSGAVFADEALSRFDGLDPRHVFDQAALAGHGSDLEARAIVAALAERRPDRMLALNVSLAALADRAVRDALPDDLNGIILEVMGDTEKPDRTDEGPLLATLRARGCRIAIDDCGLGYDLGRLLRLEPEIVKLGRALVQNLDSPQHRAVIHALTSWAHELGALVCAEGIETTEQRDVLIGLGVQLGQGYLFGRPRTSTRVLTV